MMRQVSHKHISLLYGVCVHDLECEFHPTETPSLVAAYSDPSYFSVFTLF